jgi:hypothetical protein
MLRKTFFIAFPSLATHIDFVILSAAKELLWRLLFMTPQDVI